MLKKFLSIVVYCCAEDVRISGNSEREEQPSAMAFLSRSLASIGDLYGAKDTMSVVVLRFRDSTLERDY